jgi:hypothetical protein
MPQWRRGTHGNWTDVTESCCEPNRSRRNHDLQRWLALTRYDGPESAAIFRRWVRPRKTNQSHAHCFTEPCCHLQDDKVALDWIAAMGTNTRLAR